MDHPELISVSVSLSGNGQVVIMPKFADRTAFDKYGRAEVLAATEHHIKVKLYTDLDKIKRELGRLPGYTLGPENGGVHWERRAKFQDSQVFQRKANLINQPKEAVLWDAVSSEDVQPHLLLNIRMPEWFSTFMRQPTLPELISTASVHGGQPTAMFKRPAEMPPTIAPKATNSVDAVDAAIDLLQSMKPVQVMRFIRRMRTDAGITAADYQEVAGA